MSMDILGCLKLPIIAMLALFIITPVHAAGSTNVSILYGWNGTNFVPLLTNEQGKLLTDLNMSRSIGLSPLSNNTYDLGTTALLWANLYVRSVRGQGGTLSLYTGTTEAVTIAGGNVGVNSANPQYKLEVGGNANITGEVLVSNVSILTRTSSDNTTQSDEINTKMNVTGGNYIANVTVTTITVTPRLDTAGNTSLNVNNTLYVNASADRVGVGTSSPTQALHVVGSLNVTGSIWSNDANISAFTNVSLTYGWNTTNFVPLLTTGQGILKLSTTQASASNLAGPESNGTSLILTRNLTVLKNLSVGTTTLFVDQTATRVGIATASPAATLEVSGSNIVNNISLNVNNTLYVNASGNVGIGTTSPDTKSLLTLQRSGVDNKSSIMFKDQAGTSMIQIGIEGVVDNDFFIRRMTDSTDLVYIDKSTGNVGIGTTGPTRHVEIAGAEFANPSLLIRNTAYSSANSTGNVSLQFAFNNHISSKIEANKFDTSIVGLNFYGEYDYNVPSLIMTLKPTSASGGNVGIGTTNPSRNLHIVGSTAEIQFNDTDAPNRNWHIGPLGSTGGFNFAETGVADGRLFIQNGTGNVGIGDTSPTNGKLEVNGEISTGNEGLRWVIYEGTTNNDGSALLIGSPGATFNSKVVGGSCRIASGNANPHALVWGYPNVVGSANTASLTVHNEGTIYIYAQNSDYYNQPYKCVIFYID